MVYHQSPVLHIEVYTDFKDPEKEANLENILRLHELFYSKSEVWIKSEKLYEVLYEVSL